MDTILSRIRTICNPHIFQSAGQGGRSMILVHLAL